jgi:toxin ParE1/3/4
VGHRYLNSANQAFEELARMPGLGSPQEFDNPDLAGLRCWRVPGFEKHLIYYLTLEDGIKIVRVLHGARDVRGILEAEDVE